MTFIQALSVIGTAMVPILEVKGAIGLGKIHGMTAWESYACAELGSIVPILFILLCFPMLMRWLRRFKRPGQFADWLERRTMNKGAKVEKFKLLGLFLFVAIPLPTTGVWTGSMLSVLLGMKRWPSFFVILLGNLVAGLAMLAMLYTW